jgi:hypothetical protein
MNILCCFSCCWTSIEFVKHTVTNMNFLFVHLIINKAARE